MKTPSQIIQDEIRDLMQQGVTLKRIAEIAEVDRTTLWKWMRGEAPRGIGANSFDRLCAAFGYSLTRKPLRLR
jgi:transcriptional regulator with XRE-family HTH domain